ncbi:MAG: hypothetical protein U5L00_15870 [Desulfovermiculus sp.]|nr:hypothetical protein [Desulfovermiculus sp.]
MAVIARGLSAPLVFKMTHEQKTKCLILPGDSPPSSGALKHQALFFDAFAIASPEDKALINFGEITEDFPGMSITWADYANYPQSDGFKEEYRETLAHADKLIKRGILRVLPAREKKPNDAGANYVLYNSAISEQGLVSRAIPDINNKNPTVLIPNGMISGGGVSQSGCSSKYELKVNSPCKLEGVSDQWKVLAYLRVGRALKYMRRANVGGYIPVSIDPVNHSLCSYLTKSSNYNTDINIKIVEDFVSYGISIGSVDPMKLELELNEMSWDDVIKLRKEILPKVEGLRNYMLSNINPIVYHQLSQEEVLASINGLREDFRKKQEEVAEEMEKLRIGSIFKGGGAIGAGTIGMSLFPSLTGTWQEILIRVVGMGLVSMSALTPEIKTLIPARRKYRNHPLFFTTMLPKQES